MGVEGTLGFPVPTRQSVRPSTFLCICLFVSMVEKRGRVRLPSLMMLGMSGHNVYLFSVRSSVLVSVRLDLVSGGRGPSSETGVLGVPFPFPASSPVSGHPGRGA